MTCPAPPASRRGRAWAWVLAAGVIAAAAVRAPGAAGDVRAVAANMSGLRLAWLGAAVTAQTMALASGTAAQRQLLGAGGARLRWRTVSGLVLASTGVAKVMPAGPVAGGAWQVREYRRRGAGTGPGVWAVLAGGVYLHGCGAGPVAGWGRCRQPGPPPAAGLLRGWAAGGGARPRSSPGRTALTRSADG